MVKEKKSASRKYLKILGIIALVLACLLTILGIMFIVMRNSMSLTDLGVASLPTGVTEDSFKILVGSMIIVSGVIEALVGWLLIRAANDPRKTTFLFVLLVLEVISGVYTLIQTASQGTGASASGAGAILSLAISVLALFATYKARQEVNK